MGTILFSIIISLVLFYPICLLIDMELGKYIEKKNHLWPCIDFHCFCGKVFNTSLSPLPIVDFSWRICKCIRHTKKCLVFQMTTTFNGDWKDLTLYNASQVVEEMKRSGYTDINQINTIWKKIYLDSSRRKRNGS